jgi:hypothetical protein
MKTNLTSFIIAIALTTSLSGCYTSTRPSAKQEQLGFTKLTDLPVPKSSKMNLDRSMIVCGSDNWTGNLVYQVNKSQSQVIKFISNEMRDSGWTKLSEITGKEAVMVFMKDQRIAVVKIVVPDKTYLNNRSNVYLHMTNSDPKVTLVTPYKHKKENKNVNRNQNEYQNVNRNQNEYQNENRNENQYENQNEDNDEE